MTKQNNIIILYYINLKVFKLYIYNFITNEENYNKYLFEVKRLKRKIKLENILDEN